MINNINTIISHNGYPIFTSKQVLSKDDLNNLVNYLDEQNRLTRAYLIGMGIVCGLEVSSTDKTQKAQIEISAGCGITSEGYVIALSTTKLTHYQDKLSVSSTLFAPSEPHLSTGQSEDFKVIELFEKSSNKGQTLKKDLLSDRVLVIVCELQDVERDKCRLDYNNPSQERSLVYRFFLLPLTLVKKKLLKTDQLPSHWQRIDPEAIFTVRNHYLQEFDSNHKKFTDFAPKVQRFGYTRSGKSGNSIDLTKISDYKTFWENYYQVCDNAIAEIGKAFPKLFRLFSPFFTTFQPDSGHDFSQLQHNLKKRLNSFKPKSNTVEAPEATYALQYFYDYLSQLVAAFYELAEAAFDLTDDCTPDTRRFPKFLMLGLVPPISSESNKLLNEPSKGYILTSPYRTHFTQPPIYNSNQVRLQQVRYLYERLLKFCAEDSFYLLPFYKTPLKITPSKDRSALLSEQAIPYYLNYPNLYKYWNYDAYRKGRSDRHPAYFFPKNSSGDNSSVFNDLIYRLDGYNFYRIEGHIGKSKGDMLLQLQNYKQQYNLPFDVISLKLGSQKSIQEQNISGQFSDLEIDFILIKYTFQQLWKKKWRQNVFLQTLKRFFFDQPNLRSITSSQLFNPILDYARKPKNYEFYPVEPQNPTNTKFQLYLCDDSNRHIARYVTQPDETKANSFDDFNNVIFDFSELSSDAIALKKQRVANEKAGFCSQYKVTYGIVIDSSNYYLKLVLTSEENQQSPASQSSSSPNNNEIILISLNHFTVSVEPNEPPIILQPEFRNFEILYGLLSDLPETFNTEKYQMGNKEIAEQLNYQELEGLLRTYQQRLEQVMQLQLFDKFAKQHPGMEHLGGVPKGGTFILVYVDGEDAQDLLKIEQDPEYFKVAKLRTETIEKAALLPSSFPDELPTKDLISSLEKLLPELQKRKDIVVADFCVPYRCISDITSASYVVTRSRPIILLEKKFFCEGDRHKYQFTLEPKDGSLKGEGVLVEESKKFFQPSNIDQASKDILAKGQERTITFIYTLDNTEEKLTVTIHPLPNAGFQVGNQASKTSFCA
ncbi:MAG: hypothetical protein KME33_37065, partial [Aetokthonos hydrillicola CCALA 1050]|nr:hypothetical protein [Aetokthonos hydrillicola CCALA 1050]